MMDLLLPGSTLTRWCEILVGNFRLYSDKGLRFNGFSFDDNRIGKGELSEELGGEGGGVGGGGGEGAGGQLPQDSML